MIKDIDELKNNFNLMNSFRRNSLFCLETYMSSNVCVTKLNNTIEANIFNLIRQSLYMRAIIELRKILEPQNHNKNANLSSIINYINNNKDVFAKQHYVVDLNIGSICIEDIDQEFYKKFREYSAYESKEKCLKTISLLKGRWNKYWHYLSNSDSFKIIRENRDYLVHSYSNTVESFPSINKIKKVLRITTWFIKKIDYIINNCSFSYDTELEKVRYISTEYWDLINK